MKTKNQIKGLFVSEVRVNILKLLLLNPDKSIHVRAIVRAVDAEINAVRRELDNLIRIGLLTKRQSSNKIFYKAEPSHPFFPELLSLLAKEEGIGFEIIRNEDKLGDIDYAVLSRAFLRGRESSALDVDLFIVGRNINVSELEKIVKSQETILGKEINFSVMDPEQFTHRKRTNDPFVMRVLSQTRTMLIGNEEKFCAIIDPINTF